MQSKELDIGPRFKAARHEKGFKAENGGDVWKIRVAGDDDQHVPAQIVLPSSMIQTLDQLNTAQKAVNQAEEHIRYTRSLLFTDWYKYMVCEYPGEDAGDVYPDIDYVKWFIESKDLPQVQQAIQDSDQKQAAITPIHTTLSQQITDFNNSTISKSILLKKLNSDTADTTGITLVNASGWEKNDPFSTHCKFFNGTDAYVSIASGQSVKALSLWLHLSAQKDDNGTLLATQDLGTLITKGNVSSFYTKIAINGEVHPSFRPLHWHHLPQGQWFHLYIECNDALSTTDVIYLFGQSGGHFIQGKLAGIRLFNATLTDDEIINDQNMLGHQTYELKQTAGPRFWHPTEPVVLLEGAAVEPTNRHGEDGRLQFRN